MPIQHVMKAYDWFPTAQLGTTHGNNAANHAINIGFPSNVNVWLDLETPSGDATAQDVIAYCKAWYHSVARAGYFPGLYVGADSRLTSKQLYYELPFKHYWKSMSDVPPVAIRNYQMVQYPTEFANRVSIDPDITYIDDKEGVPQWLILKRERRKKVAST